MEVTERRNGEIAELIVSGRLDTNTAPVLETTVKNCVKNTKHLSINLQNVEYISSAGLRVVLVAHKLMAAAGGMMIIVNPSTFCRQVFDATGMIGVLNIA